MNELLAKLVLLLDGSWRELGAGVESTRWFFATAGLPVLIAGTVLGAGLAVVSYVRTTEGLTPKARVGLGLLRFIAVVCLVTIASGAICHVRLARTDRPHLLMLVDDSPSMRAVVGPGGRDRADNAQPGQSHLQVAEKSAELLLPELSGSFNVQTLRTSEVLGLEADGEKPQSLAEAVVRAASRSDERAPLAGVLLISDGIQTGQADLQAAAKDVPVSVSTLGLGTVATGDVVLHSAVVPPFVYHRDRTMVAASVRSYGMNGEAVVRLLALRPAGETEIASAKVTLKPDGSPTPARVEFAAEDLGLQRFILRIAPMSGELTDVNNSLQFHLDVRPEKLRVLVVEANAGWEYKWVRRALETDPAIEFYGLVRLPPDEWFFQGNNQRPDKKPVVARTKDGFPGSIEELAFFDVLILGDVERKVLEQAGRFEMVQTYVLQNGGGLATVGGMSVYSAGNYDDTPLARLLPVAVEREKKQHLINRFNVELTGRGMMHPVMQLEYDPEKNADAWGKLPWVEGGNAWRRVKPGATSLLVHPTLKTAFGQRPAAAAWQCGRGRVFSTALDTTWHWSLDRETDIDYHRRFWGLMMRWLGGDPRLVRGNVLILETPVCEVGRPVSVSTLLRNDAGMPIVDAAVVFAIEYPNGQKLSVRAGSDPTVPGCFRLNFDPDQTGVQKVDLEAKLPDGTDRKGAIEFNVSPSRAEYLDLRGDVNALAALSKATGGSAANAAQYQDLKLPEAKRRPATFERVVNLWRTPGIVILLVGCLAVEWFMRKRRGLA
ncbi:MAG TPA: hypothetical protein VM223_20720 [Planctomycetota bacterium]|nr:hypothetical protein [Planctomycetota bacterium]